MPRTRTYSLAAPAPAALSPAAMYINRKLVALDTKHRKTKTLALQSQKYVMQAAKKNKQKSKVPISKTFVGDLFITEIFIVSNRKLQAKQLCANHKTIRSL